MDGCAFLWFLLGFFANYLPISVLEVCWSVNIPFGNRWTFYQPRTCKHRWRRLMTCAFFIAGVFAFEIKLRGAEENESVINSSAGIWRPI